MTRTKKLEVCCYGELVGYLAETPDHVIAFQYADAWIRNGFSIHHLILSKSYFKLDKSIIHPLHLITITPPSRQANLMVESRPYIP